MLAFSRSHNTSTKTLLIEFWRGFVESLRVRPENAKVFLDLTCCQVVTLVMFVTERSWNSRETSVDASSYNGDHRSSLHVFFWQTTMFETRVVPVVRDK